ncbi:sensor histidine kinase [Nocardia cyriacigeorgica]|uniref:sensor histidine kinase n=1 Tax=Nocardia cyriacigeorgica TaxID=135487 RepID=UPI002453D582|nr:HAMP domain-containing sensor histidine kinase [Nocardia cyriacigeorgica]
MRRRLLVVLTVFAAIAVLAFAIPLSLTAATSRTQHLVLGRSGDAERFATLADGVGSTGGVQALADEVGRYHQLYGENVLVVDARGAPIVNAGVDVSDPRIMGAVAAARRNQRPQQVDRLTPWSDPVMLIARPVGTGVQVNGAVVIEASTSAARAAIARVWAVIALGAVGAMAVFILLALVLSRWVLRPLAAMSEAVADLTATLPKPRPDAPPVATGEPSAAPITRRYGGPPEVRALAESVDAMAAAVADSADAQRQLVADTAHAMRNPLAALTIRLDSLGAAVPERAAATFRGASAEVDRLTALLDALLELAVAQAPVAFGAAAPADDRCDANQVVADRIDSWISAFDAADMRLSAGEATDDASALTEAAIGSAALAQILDVALSNSCRYAGSGAHTVVDVLAEPGWVIVRVADDGPGVEPDEIDKLTSRFFRGSGAVAGGTGLGLSIAHALTKTRGGTLTVEPVRPHGLAVVIRLPEVSR